MTGVQTCALPIPTLGRFRVGRRKRLPHNCRVFNGVSIAILATHRDVSPSPTVARPLSTNDSVESIRWLRAVAQAFLPAVSTFVSRCFCPPAEKRNAETNLGAAGTNACATGCSTQSPFHDQPMVSGGRDCLKGGLPLVAAARATLRGAFRRRACLPSASSPADDFRERYASETGARCPVPG